MALKKDTSLLVTDFTDALQQELINRNKEDAPTLTLETAFSDKHLSAICSELGMQESQKNEPLRMQINKITHIELAEMNEEFF